MLTGLFCSLNQARVNNGKEIESVALQMETAVKSSLVLDSDLFTEQQERVNSISHRGH